MKNKLSRSQIDQELAYLTPYWSIKKSKLVRKFAFSNFLEAIKFTNKIAKVAEKNKHHPDIHLINYNELVVEIWTHSMRGISKKDFDLATEIDRVRP